MSEKLIAEITRELAAYSFLKEDITPVLDKTRVLAVWKRKTWNTNRAVAMIEWPGGATSPGELAQEVKIQLGRKIGYFFFFYPLGLQVIVCAKSLSDQTEGLDRYLDQLDNQRVILQSLHVVDIGGLQSSSVRTWGQFVSGRFQDAIENGIGEFISVSKHP